MGYLAVMIRLRNWLLVAFFFLGLLEGLLRTVDPNGVWQLHRIISDYQSASMPHVTRVYTMRPGFYRFDNHVVAWTNAYTRSVPDTQAGRDCSIIFVGDSLTFGWGVSDDETWVNLLARSLPGVTVINAGMNGYNIQQVSTVIDEMTADGFVWLMLQNDRNVIGGYDYRRHVSVALWDYWSVYVTRTAYRTEHARIDTALYDDLLSQVETRTDVLLVAFEGDTVTPEHVRRIAPPAHTLSNVDAHPNAAGHREIYDQMLPLVNDFVDRVC